MTVARLAAGCRGFPQAPVGLPWVAGTGPRWSAGVRQGGDPLPGPGDRLGPGPVRGDLPAPAASAADQAGGGVQDAVAQRLRFGPGEIAVQGEQPEPGEQDLRGHGGGQPGLVEGEPWEGNRPMPVSLPVRMGSSTRACTRWAASM